MKVLITNHFPLIGSGSGVYITNIAKSLIKRGHEVCIIMPENTTRISKLGKIKIHPVYFKNEEKIDNQLNFNFPCFDPHPRSSLLYYNMTTHQIKKFEQAFKTAIEEEIKDFKPDLIHAQHLWIISSIAVKYNIPVIITSHGSDMMGYEDGPQFRPYMAQAANNCKKIIAISSDSKSILCNAFPEIANKFVTISNGYDPKVFYKANYNKKKILKEYNINTTYEKIICFAGRLTKNKGVDILLRAAKLYEQNNFLTLIAGYGEEFHTLYPLMQKLKLKNVIFLGNQDATSLRKIYNISDVCVVPSRKEAFGLVALESIACGTPVIATNQGGMPDFVKKKVGILIETGNVEQLANTVLDVLNDKKHFDSDYLANYAKESFSQDFLIDKLIEIYENSIKN